MIRSALFCLGGIIFGCLAGFFIANNSAPVTANAPARPAATNAEGPAGPLSPEQLSGELPPNHPPPDTKPGPNDVSDGAATSPKIQEAMNQADTKPKDFEAQLKAAVAFYQNNGLAKAEVYLQRALALKPNDPDALTGLANTKYDQGDYASAQAAYDKVLAQRKDPDIYTDLGNTFFKRNDYERAIAAYRQALALDPKHEKAWQNIAAAAAQKGDKATIREAIDKLAALNPNNPALPSLRESLK